MTDGDSDETELLVELARLRAATDALERSARAQIAVTRALAELPAGTPEDEAMPKLVGALARALGGTLASYWVPAGDALECRATWCADDAGIAASAWDEAARRVRFAAGVGLPGVAWRERGPVRLDDPRGAEPARLGVLAGAELRAGLGIAVTAGAEVLGVIELFTRGPVPAGVPAGDVPDDLLRAIGDHIGQYVRFARAQAQAPAQPQPQQPPRDEDARRPGVDDATGTLAEERETILKLYDLGRTLGAERDPHTIARSATELATQLTGAQRGALFYRAGTGDGDGDELRVVTSGISREELAKLPMPRSTPLLGLAFNSREAIRINDVTADPRYGKNPPHRGLPGGHFPVRSYLAVPVRSRTGRVTGALLLSDERPGVFDDRAQRLAVGLAAHAATAMDNAALFADQQRLIEALEKTNAELDQFAYAASHDLRAPLRGISNLATWIEEDLGTAAPKKVREHISMLRGRAARMDRLIQGLLELARVGRARQKPERVDVTELLHETIDLLSPPQASRILIIGAMPTLFADRYALQQVLINLIGNALQHSGKSDVGVRITSTERAEEVEISIADDGVGIPPELQAQCWEVFQTLQSRDVVDTPGIGLAIVKKQVEGNGGRAWFVPRPKQGVDVRFTWRKRAK
ncbi:MAG TPA: GAF domain-containing protein [Kofleriaceae bacterium]|nr:GAF domain-containing protein [Kofleriaceae bacterium]